MISSRIEPELSMTTMMSTGFLAGEASAWADAHELLVSSFFPPSTPSSGKINDPPAMSGLESVNGGIQTCALPQDGSTARQNGNFKSMRNILRSSMKPAHDARPQPSQFCKRCDRKHDGIRNRPPNLRVHASNVSTRTNEPDRARMRRTHVTART